MGKISYGNFFVLLELVEGLQVGEEEWVGVPPMAEIVKVDKNDVFFGG